MRIRTDEIRRIFAPRQDGVDAILTPDTPDNVRAAIMVAISLAYDQGYTTAMVDYCLDQAGHSCSDGYRGDMDVMEACEIVEEMPDAVASWAGMEFDDEALMFFTNLREVIEDRLL